MAGTSKQEGTSRDRAAKYGSETHWRMVDGQWRPPELQLKYLTEWCMAWPRPHDTKAEWAAANGVTPRTLNNWESDERFQALWKRLSDKKFTNPDFLDPIIYTMERIIKSPWDAGDVSVRDRISASETLWRIMEKMSPPVKHEQSHTEDADLAQLDENELLEAAGLLGDDDGTEEAADYAEYGFGIEEVAAEEASPGGGAVQVHEFDGVVQPFE